MSVRHVHDEAAVSPRSMGPSAATSFMFNWRSSVSTPVAVVRSIASQASSSRLPCSSAKAHRPASSSESAQSLAVSLRRSRSDGESAITTFLSWRYPSTRSSV